MFRHKVAGLLISSMMPVFLSGTVGEWLGNFKIDRSVSLNTVLVKYEKGVTEDKEPLLSVASSPHVRLEEIFEKKPLPVVTEAPIVTEAVNTTVSQTTVATPAPAVTQAPVVTEPPVVTTVVEDVTIAVTEPIVYQEPEIQHAVIQDAVASPQPVVEEIDDSDVTRTGIDVSRWQGTIDWQRIKNAGIQFAIIKAGEGTEVESKFYENINGAKAVGIDCGVYWFSNAKSIEEAESEAQACLDAISGYQLEYPVVCDFEYRSLKNNPLANDKKALTDTILAFLNKTQSNGYYSMFYTNADFSSTYLEFDRITVDFDIWCAGYSIPEPNMPCGIWQHSQTGVVDGTDITGLNGSQNYVDLDISYKNYPAKMKKYHVNGY